MAVESLYERYYDMTSVLNFMSERKMPFTKFCHYANISYEHYVMMSFQIGGLPDEVIDNVCKAIGVKKKRFLRHKK